ncbi:Tetratricopeptide-like helical [Penicillium canescens]|uniref:Tetratricopeptide-like helical n=1 Tax=Penicillium canescens TaxID=5083 RepID=A0AAD6N869_PENCN|nr:Tetratricopeptide-like helical [Penicillium canescens]KAJ6019884.1 Tetratricopeptide-like helical [Penicillium canescens]KAJ6039203.1 Tetratricopeptide-like helical [Penicillium canescens]KAJ6047023.1 Tetratricopeptide-like helical [Penicillium canescens]KAJ6093640.1 Tetratricopeptide-like helical [Penicillium canescens]KAJ6174562.1 Tetratricopeptide-like helical [Penicillium canescens]
MATHPEEFNTSEYCGARWNDAVQLCKDRLPLADFKKVLECSTCEELIHSLQKTAEQANKKIPWLLGRLDPFLHAIRQLNLACALALGARFTAGGIIWGIMMLLIEVTVQSEQLLTRTVELTDQLTGHMELLQLYHPLEYGNALLDKAIVEVFVEIIMFWSHTVRFLRRNPVESLAVAAWTTNVLSEFRQTVSRIDAKVNHVKAIISAIEQRRKMENDAVVSRSEVTYAMANPRLNNPSASHSNYDEGVVQSMAELPCNNIPLARNQSFFGRDEILTNIRTFIRDNDINRQQRSMMLWSAGGVGKTQIALAYAHEERERGVGSFTAAAVLLKLTGASRENDLQTNKDLLMKWLQSTESEWLLFGGILITSRTEMDLINFNVVSFEIPVFGNNEAGQLIMNIIGRSHYSTDEIAAAGELSKFVGGLALAVVILALNIRRRRCQIRQFCKLYEKNAGSFFEESKPSDLGPYYAHSLTTAWKVAFQSIGENALSLFGSISVLGPDNIPEELFETSGADFSDNLIELAVCFDEWNFEQTVHELIRAGLIRRSSEDMTLFVHRVIQLNFRSFLDHATFLKLLGATGALLARKFPPHKRASFRTYPELWAQGQRYIAHVVCTLSHISDVTAEGDTVPGREKFISCLAAAGRFLFDMGNYAEGLDLLKRSMQISVGHEDSFEYMLILNEIGNIYALQNKTSIAQQYLTSARDIGERILDPMDPLLAAVYNNFGNSLLSQVQTAEARAYYEKALNIYLSLPAESGKKDIVCIYQNIAIGYTMDGNHEQARPNLLKCRKLAIETFGEKTEFEAQSYYVEGQICEAKGAFTEAEKLYENSYQLFSNLAHMHPIVGAKLLRLGSLSIKQEDADKAVDYLKAALKLSQYNERTQGDKGDYARVLWKLSQALELKNEGFEARRLRQQAEGIRRAIQGSRFDELPATDDSYNILVAAYFRPTWSTRRDVQEWTHQDQSTWIRADKVTEGQIGMSLDDNNINYMRMRDHIPHVHCPVDIIMEGLAM